MEWEVYTTDDGDLYFYNTKTGETKWELTKEDINQIDDTPNEKENDDILHLNESTRRNGQKTMQNEVNIALEIAIIMVKLLDNVECIQKLRINKAAIKFMNISAEQRYKKNIQRYEKKYKRLYEQQLKMYINIILVQGNGLMESKINHVNACIEMKKDQLREEKLKRKLIRKNKAEHHKDVLQVQKYLSGLRNFRSSLIRHLIKDLQCDEAMKKHAILMLENPTSQNLKLLQNQFHEYTDINEFIARKKHEETEKFELDVYKIFQMMNKAYNGGVYLTTLLLAMTTPSDILDDAKLIPGLSGVVGNKNIQRFILDFAANSEKEQIVITENNFFAFVCMLRDVLNHFELVKCAVKMAMNNQDAISWNANSKMSGMSFARKKMYAIKQSKAVNDALWQHEAKNMENKFTEEKRKPWDFQPAFQFDDELHLPIWERGHHHRYIQLNESQPSYCCECRRRKWEHKRAEKEKEETEYRGSLLREYRIEKKGSNRMTILHQKVSNACAFLMQNLESKYLNSMHTIITPTQDKAVLSADLIEISAKVNEIITLIEKVYTEKSKVHREDRKKQLQISRINRMKPALGKNKYHKKTKQASCTIANTTEEQTKSTVEPVVKYEGFEIERHAMFEEECINHIIIERLLQQLENPLLKYEKNAHAAYVRVLTHCPHLPSFLTRLYYERCLSFNESDVMVVQLLDRSTQVAKVCKRYILQIVPGQKREIEYIYSQGKAFHRRLYYHPSLIQIESIAKNKFQYFAENGILVEQYSILFVLLEFASGGEWAVKFRQNILCNLYKSFEQVEMELLGMIKDVAQSLLAIHSIGILHLNLNLGNIYLHESKIKVGGLLGWKSPYIKDDLVSSIISQLSSKLPYIPPEISRGTNEAVSEKTDVWLLGSVIYQGLMLWQTCQLGNSAESKCHELKTMEELVNVIPLKTSPVVRSLLRMLLQPYPSQRPSMDRVVDYLSMAMKATR